MTELSPSTVSRNHCRRVTAIAVALSAFLAAALGASSPARAALTRSEYRELVARFEARWQGLARERGETLVVYAEWSDSKDAWAASFARRWSPEAQILVYGGLPAQPAMTPEAMVLALCHELGHLYGGEPFRDPQNQVSLEGQADYWAGSSCIVESLIAGTAEGERASRAPSPTPEPGSAALTLGQVLARLRGEAAPSADTPDPSVVSTPLTGHPSLQCRLDTWLAGLRGLERPRCWYAPPHLTH